MQPPFITVPKSLTHILEGATLTPETSLAWQVDEVTANGESLILRCSATEGPCCDQRLSPKQHTMFPMLVPSTEMAMAKSLLPEGKLLGKSVRTLRGISGVVVASWEARRDVEEWDVAPVVTFLLVNAENAAYVVELADIFVQ